MQSSFFCKSTTGRSVAISRALGPLRLGQHMPRYFKSGRDLTSRSPLICPIWMEERCISFYCLHPHQGNVRQPSTLHHFNGSHDVIMCERHATVRTLSSTPQPIQSVIATRFSVLVFRNRTFELYCVVLYLYIYIFMDNIVYLHTFHQHLFLKKKLWNSTNWVSLNFWIVLLFSMRQRGGQRSPYIK